MAAVSRIVCVLLVLSVRFAVVTEAALVETYNGYSCTGTPTMTFKVSGDHHCQTFNSQNAVKVSQVSSGTRISYHNAPYCESSSQVAQNYGGGCATNGPFHAVWID